MLRLPTGADCVWRVYEKGGAPGAWRIDAEVQDAQTGITNSPTWAVPQIMLRRKDDGTDETPGRATVADLEGYIRDRLGMSSARFHTGDLVHSSGLPFAEISSKPVVDPNDPPEKPGGASAAFRRGFFDENKPKENLHGWRQ